VTIEEVKLANNKSMFVEVLDLNISDDIAEKMKKQIIEKTKTSGLADDAEDVGLLDDVKMSMELIKHDLSNIAATVKDSFKKNQPDEYSVEVSFGFAGEFTIPYITSAKSNGAIKVKATWKKDSLCTAFLQNFFCLYQEMNSFY